MSTETRQLEVKLSEDEVASKALQLARTLEEISDIEKQAKESARKFGEQLKTRRSSVELLARAVTSRKERRPVVVSERADERRFCVEIVRHDTMEVIDSRPMSTDEMEEARQGSLFARSTADSDDGPPPDEAGPCAECGAKGGHALSCSVLGLPEATADATAANGEPAPDDPATTITATPELLAAAERAAAEDEKH